MPSPRPAYPFTLRARVPGQTQRPFPGLIGRPFLIAGLGLLVALVGGATMVGPRLAASSLSGHGAAGPAPAGHSAPGPRLTSSGIAGPGQPPPPIAPAKLRWLAIADSGSGDSRQQAVADQMVRVQLRSPVDLVLMAGDNIYPDGNLDRVEATFLRPYRALLQAKVPFHAVLGNHDIRTGNGDPQVAYPLFGMKGRWYSLRRGPVEFFLLDTNMNARWQHQMPWLRRSLAASSAPWKVVVGHHPIYSSGLYGDDPAAIARLTPLFRQYGVQLYINGHEHHYERSRVINGTTYLQVGGAGAALRAVVPAERSARALSRHSFAELTATPTTLQVIGWDDKGQQIDSAVLNR